MKEITLANETSTEAIEDLARKYIGGVAVVGYDGTVVESYVPIQVTYDNVIIEDFISDATGASGDTLDITLKDLLFGEFKDAQGKVGEYDTTTLQNKSVSQWLNETKDSWDKEFFGIYYPADYATKGEGEEQITNGLPKNAKEGAFAGGYFTSIKDIENYYYIIDTNNSTEDFTVYRHCSEEEAKSRQAYLQRSFYQTLLERRDFWSALQTDIYTDPISDGKAIVTQTEIKNLFSNYLSNETMNSILNGGATND